MSVTAIALVGLLCLILLLFSNMPVGFVMAIVGFVGYATVVNLDAALSLISMDVWENLSSYGLTVIPLFVLMGQIAFNSGISKRLYDTAYVWLGNRPGGLAMATVLACAGFSAISGSTNATAATMATVTIPEMKRFKYNVRLAAGTVAAAGSLGILIPPSVILIIYGIMTEQSISQLFAAGIIPGILLGLIFLLTIYIQVKVNPSLAPAGPKMTMKKKIASLSGIIETLIIFALIMGGMFYGIFTPTEAAAIGAFLTIVLAMFQKQLSWNGFKKSINETVKISCMIMMIVTGAVIFGKFMAITRIPFDLADWVTSLNLSRHAVIGIIILVYLFGGCFMDSLAMIMLTIPIFFPVIKTLGFDPVWFGVMIVLITEMGVITPPVGINVYVVHAIDKTLKLEDIFVGVIPMLIALFLFNLLLLWFPSIVTFLPHFLASFG